MGLFDNVPSFSPDAILGLQQSFLEDERPNKINLIIGTYTHHSKKYGGLSCVKKAQAIMLEDEQNKSYLPIRGDRNFIEEMGRLIFNEEHLPNVAGVQALGGTGALHLSASLFAATELSGVVYIPEQTWGNHVRIFSQQGLQVLRYSYYNAKTKNIDFDKLIETIKGAPRQSLVLLQCCCHNPTGVDLSEAMWRELARVMVEKELIPCFDAAYLGFGNGIDIDKQPIHICIQEGLTIFVAACASKNFSLYGSRVGYFSVYSSSQKERSAIISFLEEKIRGEYSSPPRTGALVVATILGNPYLKEEWSTELGAIREKLHSLRMKFVQTMRGFAGHTFDFISTQKGFFGYPGFSEQQVEFLKDSLGVYTTAGGRFNLNGITEKNIEYIAESFVKAYELS